MRLINNHTDQRVQRRFQSINHTLTGVLVQIADADGPIQFSRLMNATSDEQVMGGNTRGLFGVFPEIHWHPMDVFIVIEVILMVCIYYKILY